MGEDHDLADQRGQADLRRRRPHPDHRHRQEAADSSTARPARLTKIEGDDHRRAARRPRRRGRSTFDASEFKDFRHGYAGTIYKGQGRTLDQTYLYHSEHWRSAASYVALTRHRDKAEVFVARNTAPDLKQLARQMARVDNRRAASHYFQAGGDDSGQAAAQSAAPSGPGSDMSEQPTAKGRESEPDSFDADLLAAKRAAAEELSKPQDRSAAEGEDGRIQDAPRATKSRSRRRAISLALSGQGQPRRGETKTGPRGIARAS